MKEVLQIAYLRHLQDFYLFESVKDGIIVKNSTSKRLRNDDNASQCTNCLGRPNGRGSLTVA